jgi:ribonuclease-3
MLRMGKGEIATGGLARTSNLADAMEAVIGAIHLDSGF